MIPRKHFDTRLNMRAGPDFSAVAGLIGEPARATIMAVLLGGGAHPATMLAAHAGISPQTASTHLAKLAKVGLLTVIRTGRYRLYRLSRPEIANALEALAAISPQHAIKSMRQSDESVAMRLARMCYDHLAGYIGVAVTEALAGRRLIAQSGQEFRITKKGRSWLVEFGIDPESLTVSRRKVATQCLDWSERRPHVGGALGAALASRMIERGWFAPVRSNRSLKITADGERSLLRQFGIGIDGQSSAMH